VDLGLELRIYAYDAYILEAARSSEFRCLRWTARSGGTHRNWNRPWWSWTHEAVYVLDGTAARLVDPTQWPYLVYMASLAESARVRSGPHPVSQWVDELGSKFGRAAVVAESGKVGPDDEIWHRALFRGLASARATANR
jgi:hypothetical protein